MKTNFLEFLGTLQNVEKTRNFNVFKDYNLDFFQKTMDPLIETYKNHKPIRISVVGTNAKGSTSFYLAQILNKHLKTAIFTSPHLISPYERCVVLGEEQNETLIENVFQSKIFPNLQSFKSLSYFEFLTAFAYVFFAEQKTRVEIWEAGLGGRLDATKLVHPDFVVLTKIGLDHSEILGETEDKILLEKLGIICENTKQLFAMTQKTESIENTIKTNSPVPFKIFRGKEPIEGPTTYSKNSGGFGYLDSNFHFAKLVTKSIFPKIAKTISDYQFSDFPKPKGRMEVLRNSPLVVFDPAHNPDAVAFSLAEFRSEHSQFFVLLGSLPDKDLIQIQMEVRKAKPESIFYLETAGMAKFPTGNFPSEVHCESLETVCEFLSESKTPIFVLGSFRMYGIVSNLLQNTINV
ncbi:bifunctional folylpolyglutamate synthase/dihydrofolate synthase [Leptospira sp. 96542]|nr:bifunctional folylpolyglutamate synthase/dihydrofolate synthase [Leptospira sp. 96542]